MDKPDLLQLARDYAASSTDLYSLLKVDTTATADEVHRAWKRQGLKYHPDKARASYDATKYESLERARNVLADPAARAAYDNARGAELARKRRLDAMGKERRRFAEQLEAAERTASHGPSKFGPRLPDVEPELDPEERARREAGRDKARRYMETRRRERAEAERELAARGEDENEARERREQDQDGQAQSNSGGSRAPHASSADSPTAAAGREPSTTADEDYPMRDADDGGGEEDLDSKLADVERRLREAQQRRAQRKADKADKADKRSGGSSRRDREPPPPNKAEAKEVPSVEATPKAASASSKPSSMNRLDLMAKLKAAQAKKEEQKRLNATKEEEAARTQPDQQDSLS